MTTYFRRFKIKGKEKIKKRGPYIFVSNHPSAFMDPVAVATSIRPTVYFLAAAEFMGNGFKYWFMHRFLNMIPIYRPTTASEEMYKNEAIFDKCIQHLNKGRSILVFPEGASVTEKKIDPFKTGIARIIRATELANDLKANIQVIPIGLNYSDPHTFRSDLFVNIGDPIQASNFFSLTKDVEQEIAEVKKLTQHLEDELIKTVLHVENLDFEGLLDKVNGTYGPDLKAKLGVDYGALAREFELNKLIISAFSHFENSTPKAFEQMRLDIEAYIKKLDQHGINDREMRVVNNRTSFFSLLYLVWAAPIFLLGFFGNIIPHQLTVLIQRKIDVQESFKGSIILATGMLVFLLWYTGLTVLLWVLTPFSYFSLLLPIVFYLTGILALVYSDIVKFISRRRRLRKYLNTHQNIKPEIITARNVLISQFEDFRTAYNGSRLEMKQ